MEHKLILGGEQYLPFARSRIKALHATGLEYASQSFEVDGVSIKVRITPGYEYIRLEGGSVTMKMDSGMLGITGGIGENSIWRYDPGYLLDCGPTVTYNAAFVKKPQAPWTRVNPSKNNDSQFAGDVSISSTTVKGVIREDLDMTAQPRMDNRPAAASLSPAWEEVPDSVPLEQRVQANDGELVAKKASAIFCPASTFTGRCRLYIQAIYGLPLYEYAEKYRPGGVRGKSTKNSPINLDPIAAPFLKIRSYVAEDDLQLDPAGFPTIVPTDYPDVVVDTSCGVMLDTHGNHWLIQLVNGNIRVFPLVSDKNGESLRKHLRAKIDGTFRFGEVAREHLETYILARCLPDTRNVKLLKTKYTCGDFSMGYGWHWNWSGQDSLTADIVINDIIPPLPGLPNTAKMNSAHFRLLVQMTPKPVPQDGWKKNQKDRQDFSAVFSVVENYTQWNLLRSLWCITAPEFASQTLSKITPKLSALFPCDAPFYVFYTRNDLKVCRVKVTLEPATTGTRKKSKNYAVGDLPGSEFQAFTLGAQDGYVNDVYDSPAYHQVVFSIGSATSPKLVFQRGTSGFNAETTNKVRLAEAGPRFSGGSFNNSIYADVGDPDDLGNYQQQGPFAGFGSPGWFFRWSWDYAEYQTEESYLGLACIVVPFFDAESIYMQTQENTTKTKKAHSKSTSTNPSNIVVDWTTRAYIGLQDGSRLGPFDRNEYFPSRSYFPTIFTQIPDVVDAENKVTSNIYCKAGKLSCFWDGTGEFFNNALDEVGQQFYTLSGTSTQHPTVFCAIRKVTHGINLNVEKDIPITTVGWV